MSARQVVTGLSIGDTSTRPYREEYDAVLTIGDRAGVVDDDVRHRHIVWRGDGVDVPALNAAVQWVGIQWTSSKRVLVRCTDGPAIPALVVALVFTDLGAHLDEAMATVADELNNTPYSDYLRN